MVFFFPPAALNWSCYSYYSSFSFGAWYKGTSGYLGNLVCRDLFQQCFLFCLLCKSLLLVHPEIRLVLH